MVPEMTSVINPFVDRPRREHILYVRRVICLYNKGYSTPLKVSKVWNMPSLRLRPKPIP